MINHRYFGSEKMAQDRFGFDFQKKQEIILLMVKQELFRDKLCYGKHKDRRLVEDAIKNLYMLKEIIEQELGEAL